MRVQQTECLSESTSLTGGKGSIIFGGRSLQSAKCHNFPYIFPCDDHVAFSFL
jgi:hypothetical protein